MRQQHLESEAREARDTSWIHNRELQDKEEEDDDDDEVKPLDLIKTRLEAPSTPPAASWTSGPPTRTPSVDATPASPAGSNSGTIRIQEIKLERGTH